MSRYQDVYQQHGQQNLFENAYLMQNVVAPEDDIISRQALGQTHFQNQEIRCFDENEDARPKRKGSLKLGVPLKQLKLDSNGGKNDRNRKDLVLPDNPADKEELNYALVPEHDARENNQGLVMLKHKEPQENSSSPTTTSDRSLFSEILQSKENFGFVKEVKYALEKHQGEELNPDEANYLVHIAHAFHCPTLEGNDCFLPFCKDPKTIKDFVEDNLSKPYHSSGNAVDQQSVNTIYKINIVHTVNCPNRIECNMPLCKGYDMELKELFPEEIKDDNYTMLFNTKEDESQSYLRGSDFQILFEINIGKGSFGSVTNCWFVDSNKRSSSMAMKRISLIGQQKVSQALAHSLSGFKDLKNCPNVLVPDLVMRSDSEVLMIMEKADISLFDYVKMHGGNGVPIDACTSILFQMAKGLKQIHSCGFTHGDFKVSNCVLTNGYTVAKIIDLDTIKKEDVMQFTGTKLYAAPEVLENKTVRKPADIFSWGQCIAVMLYGSEKILEEKNRSKIHQLVATKDRELADIYHCGTQEDPTKRITAPTLVRWFRKNAPLKQRWRSYKPADMIMRPMPGETLCSFSLRSYFTAVMDDLPRHLFF